MEVTPTQIATQSMKGCGISTLWAKGYYTCGGFEDLKHSDHYIYCETCKSKILAHKQDWENELEKWNELEEVIIEYPNSIKLLNITKPRISELTSALKILEEIHSDIYNAGIEQGKYSQQQAILEIIDNIPVVKRLKDGSQVPFKEENALVLTAFKNELKALLSKEYNPKYTKETEK